MVTTHLNRTMAQEEVESFSERLKSAAEEWWMDSKLLSPKHFIAIIEAPDGYHKRLGEEYNMVIKLDISCLSREPIEKNRTHFIETYTDEMQRLLDGMTLVL